MFDLISNWMQACIDWEWADVTGEAIGPGMFSGFHLLWLGIMVVFSAAVALLLGRKHTEKRDRTVVGVFAGILVLGEVFKQLFWWEFYGYYRWQIFPFQFCSVPIYVAVFAAVCPWEKVRELCFRFLAFFGIIGGLAVMLVPVEVLYTYFVAISLHSMIWHSILVAMGVYLIVSRGYGRRLVELLQPFYMFLVFVILAIVGNVLVYKLHLEHHAVDDDMLSMFYLSPYYPTSFPLLGGVQEFSYPLFVLTYVALFTAFSMIVWGVARLCRVKKKEKLAV